MGHYPGFSCLSGTGLAIGHCQTQTRTLLLSVSACLRVSIRLFLRLTSLWPVILYLRWILQGSPFCVSLHTEATIKIFQKLMCEILSLLTSLPRVLTLDSRWLGGVVVTTLDLRLSGRGFNSWQDTARLFLILDLATPEECKARLTWWWLYP